MRKSITETVESKWISIGKIFTLIINSFQLFILSAEGRKRGKKKRKEKDVSVLGVIKKIFFFPKTAVTRLHQL